MNDGTILHRLRSVNMLKEGARVIRELDPCNFLLREYLVRIEIFGKMFPNNVVWRHVSFKMIYNTLVQVQNRR